MKKLEFKQLEYFLAVAHYLSFTKAAEVIHVAQPAISQQIKQLERDLGITLFHRDNKKVRLTEAGELLRRHAEEVLSKVDKTIRVMDELSGLERGSVSIGMSSTMANLLMVHLVGEFQKKLPHIKLKISETITSNSIHRLKDGELDIAIVSLPLRDRDIDEHQLQVSTLYEESLEAIVPASHPLAVSGVSEINLIELNQFNWILANNSNTLRRIINQACEEKGFCPIVRVEVDRIGSVKNLLLASNKGVSILPPTTISFEESYGLVKRIKIKDMNVKRGVGIINKPQQLLPPATIQMIELIKDICNQYPDNLSPTI